MITINQVKATAFYTLGNQLPIILSEKQKNRNIFSMVSPFRIFPGRISLSARTATEESKEKAPIRIQSDGT